MSREGSLPAKLLAASALMENVSEAALDSVCVAQCDVRWRWSAGSLLRWLRRGLYCVRPL